MGCYGLLGSLQTADVFFTSAEARDRAIARSADWLAPGMNGTPPAIASGGVANDSVTSESVQIHDAMLTQSSAYASAYKYYIFCQYMHICAD